MNPASLPQTPRGICPTHLAKADEESGTGTEKILLRVKIGRHMAAVEWILGDDFGTIGKHAVWQAASCDTSYVGTGL
jgi:hypothetical protein